MGPKAGLDVEKKNSRPYRDPNSDPSVVQPAASRNTDCAVPAPPSLEILGELNESKIMRLRGNARRKHAQ
jgi:hypothetical protein